MSELTRRAALALVATLPAAAAPAAPAENPDAELIALGREFDRLRLVVSDAFRRSTEAFAPFELVSQA